MELDTETVPSPAEVILTETTRLSAGEPRSEIILVPPVTNQEDTGEVLRLLVAMIVAVLSMLGTMLLVYR